MILSKEFESHVESVAEWTGIGVLLLFPAMWGHLTGACSTSEVPAAKIENSQEQLSMLAI
jgi:hypothetical protein